MDDFVPRRLAQFRHVADTQRNVPLGGMSWRSAREARGAITVLISHRFSTVRMADRIAVLEDGRVTEFSDHATLMAKAGTYARLYRRQADAYA